VESNKARVIIDDLERVDIYPSYLKLKRLKPCDPVGSGMDTVGSETRRVSCMQQPLVPLSGGIKNVPYTIPVHPFHGAHGHDYFEIINYSVRPSKMKINLFHVLDFFF
jgi:hypothetical protein